MSTQTISAQTMTLHPPKPPGNTNASSLATLRALYPRAATAFLQKNISLTQSLIDTAFPILQPPSTTNGLDQLSSHRRKWDILRITLETTLYSSSPSEAEHGRRKMELTKPDLMELSPVALTATLQARSLRLFTPMPQKPSPRYLPSQILVALALTTLKLGTFDVGRTMIEEWLARRGEGGSDDSAEGYEKVLEVYVLHVLPRMEDWDAANEFLKYESELSSANRQKLVSGLESVYEHHLASSKTPTPTRNPTPSITPKPKRQTKARRAASPTPSSSSVSSASTYTAVPATPRPPAIITSALTATAVTPLLRPVPPLAPVIPVGPRREPSLLQVLRVSVKPWIQSLSTSSLLFFVLLPLIGLLFRARSRSRLVGNRGAAETARRRLRAGTGGFIRSLVDTLQMATKGLV